MKVGVPFVVYLALEWQGYWAQLKPGLWRPGIVFEGLKPMANSLYQMVFSLAFLIPLMGICGPAWSAPLSDLEKLAILEQMAVPNPETFRMYSWGTWSQVNRVAGDHLMGRIRLEMSLDPSSAAFEGGLHVNSNPVETLRFLGGFLGGDLLEVEIKKGTPILDLERDHLVLKDRGVSLEDVKRLKPRMVIIFAGSSRQALVLTNQGVSASYFSGEGLSVAQMVQYYNEITYGGVGAKVAYKLEFARQILGKRMVDIFEKRLRKPGGLKAGETSIARSFIESFRPLSRCRLIIQSYL